MVQNRKKMKHKIIIMNSKTIIKIRRKPKNLRVIIIVRFRIIKIIKMQIIKKIKIVAIIKTVKPPIMIIKIKIKTTLIPCKIRPIPIMMINKIKIMKINRTKIMILNKIIIVIIIN